MNKTSLKWLLAGLAGSALAIILLAIGTAGVIWGLANSGFALHDGKLIRVAEPERGPIQERWASWQARYLEEEGARVAETERLNLESRYTSVPLHDDTFEQLYEHKNFALVEERLTSQLNACATPLDHYRYQQHIESLGDIRWPLSPADQLEVLNSWDETRPKGYHGLLIRGWFGEEFYWSFHDTTVSEEAAKEGWMDARDLLWQSQRDLKLALDRGAHDAEILVTLMQVEFALGERRRGLQAYYEEALSLCPTHLGAREMWLHVAQPVYGGSWDDFMTIRDEAIDESVDFPLLRLVSRSADSIHATRDWESGEDYPDTRYDEDSLAAYEAQLAVTPDDVHLMASAAYYAGRGEKWDRATHWFRRIGDRYPEDSEFTNVVEFNRARARAYAMYARDPSVEGTPLAIELLAESRSLHPDIADEIPTGK